MSDPNTKTKRKNRNWELEVLPYVKRELEKFRKEGIKPTLRTIFYRLASSNDNSVRNIQSDYTSLSKLATRCRKRNITLRRVKPLLKFSRFEMLDEHVDILKSQRLLIQYRPIRHGLRYQNKIIVDESGKEYVVRQDWDLPVDCFADETRGAFIDFNDIYKTPEEQIKEKLDFLIDLPNGYKKMIPKWHEQPYYVELWTEKNAMVGTFRSILKGLDVRIVYNRGFDSVSNSWGTFQRIKAAWNKDKKVRILYFGDLDPSGDAMDEIINEFMGICFNVEHQKHIGVYDFKRVGVLYEHIEKFDLPKNPDEKVLAKLQEDPRRFQFMKKYGLDSEDDLFQIEIDALAASDPAEFKKMVIDGVKPYYDPQIYERILSDPKHSENQICIQVVEYGGTFLEESNIILNWNWLES